jgi:catechol 2,3-dioxygenase-like lactoylglutathione lyase family enzyme
MSLIGQLPIAAIRLSCKNIEESKRFYGEVLGLREIEHESDNGGVHYDVGNIRLTLAEAKGEAKTAPSSQLIFLVENAIDVVCADLTKRGVKFRSKKIVSDSAGKAAWFSDPDGNVIYLWQPPKRDTKDFREVEGIVRHYESISRALADLREEDLS